MNLQVSGRGMGLGSVVGPLFSDLNLIAVVVSLYNLLTPNNSKTNHHF